MGKILVKASENRLIQLTLVVAMALFIEFSGVTSRLEQMVADTELSLLPPGMEQDIAIVAVDEKSLRKYGRWPWSRRLHARLLDRLHEAGSGPVAFDVLFAEASDADPVGDQLFAAAIAAHGKVALAMTSDEDPGDNDVSEVLPYKLFAEAAAAIGHTDMAVDRDGIVRSAYLLAGAGAAHWPHLSLAALYLSGKFRVMELPGETFAAHSAGGKGRWVRDHKILFPFASGPGAFPMYSFADVIEGKIEPDRLRDKTLFVGITAAAIRRVFPVPDTSFGAMSGVEIHANTLNALEQGNVVTNTQGLSRILGLGLLSVVGGLILLFLPLGCIFCRLAVSMLVVSVLAMLSVVALGLLLPVVSLWSGLMIASYLLIRSHIGSLQKHSYLDVLTGLYNRRAFDEHFDRMWRLNSRHERLLFLLLIDVDCFKRFNDLMGQLKGDKALRELGRYFGSRTRRAGDITCRIGGKRFAVLLDMDKPHLEEVEAYAREIVQGIQGLGIHYRSNGKTYQLTVSVGCAAMVPGVKHSKNELFDMADKALYQAKHSGRNQVSCDWSKALFSTSV